MALLAGFTGALAVFLLVYTLFTPSRAAAGFRSRLIRYERAQSGEPEEVLARPFYFRVIVPLMQRFERIAKGLLPGSVMRSLEQKLVVAGEPLSLFGFLTVQVLAAGVALTVGVVALSASLRGIPLLIAAAVALIVAVAPQLWLSSRVEERKSKIRKALPDAVDLIVTTVEAGMAIDASLQEVAGETPGPLGEEIRIAVRETALGRGRRDALAAVIDRTGVPELKTFIQSIIQAEQTGIPLGPVLRTQAVQLRLKRRQHAEAEIQKAPIKMVLVVATMVLPSLLIVMMGPAVMRILGTI